MYELSTIFDSRKSFYGKAIVDTIDNYIYLYSYLTKVCRYNKDTKEVEDLDYYPHSSTTNRHVREFKRQIEAGYIS